MIYRNCCRAAGAGLSTLCGPHPLLDDQQSDGPRNTGHPVLRLIRVVRTACDIAGIFGLDNGRQVIGSHKLDSGKTGAIQFIAPSGADHTSWFYAEFVTRNHLFSYN